jgi:prevent-host-death family protein
MAKIRKSRKHLRRTKKVWQLQEAKARFSELVNEVEHGGYQTITKNGHEVAIIISKEEFENLRKPKNTLLDFFNDAPYPEVDLDIERDHDLGREVDL